MWIDMMNVDPGKNHKQKIDTLLFSSKIIDAIIADYYICYVGSGYAFYSTITVVYLTLVEIS